MSDIRTMQTVTVNDYYRVAIAETNGDYEAAVVETRKSDMGQALSAALSLGQNTGEWYSFNDAPRVIDEDYYVAVGRAIEAYLDADDEGDE